MPAPLPRGKPRAVADGRVNQREIQMPVFIPAEPARLTADPTRVDVADLIALRASASGSKAGTLRAREPRAGAHASTLRGRGMDYAESRAYQPGDDVRNIDWRRTARSGKWHTKLFEEDHARTLLLVVDTHATLHFGTRVRYKSVALARAAAWLAWAGLRDGDRVGALAFGAVRAAIHPHAGRRGALAVLGALARWDAVATSAGVITEALSVALHRARELATPGCRIVLLTDGWCVDPAATRGLVQLARHADLRVVIVTDALEQTLAPPGHYAVATARGRAAVDLGSKAARTDFCDRLAHGWRALAAACDEVAVDWLELSAADEPAPAMSAWWRKQGRRS